MAWIKYLHQIQPTQPVKVPVEGPYGRLMLAGYSSNQ